MADFRVISESATEPMDLDEAAENLRVVASDDSPAAYPEAARIRSLIKAARQACEQELQLSLVTKTIEWAQNAFYPYAIELPCGPVRSVVSVTYQHNTTGDDVVMSAADYRLIAHKGLLLPLYGVDWPVSRVDMDAVRIRYTAGYPSADSPAETVPEPIRQAMHLFIAHWFSNREAVDLNTMMELPLGARYLLGTYRQGLGV